MTENSADNDAATYCGVEYGEAGEGECECPRCRVIPSAEQPDA